MSSPAAATLMLLAVLAQLAPGHASLLDEFQINESPQHANEVIADILLDGNDVVEERVNVETATRKVPAGGSQSRDVQSPWSTTRGFPDEPEFHFPIGNLTVPVGREAVLSCTVDNLGKFKVGWLKVSDQTVLSMDTRVVTHSSRISVTHDNHKTWQLRIRQVRVTDGGCYMCQINTQVMKSQLGCIDVHVPPDILNEESSADQVVREGDNATLHCEAVGHPPPRVTWKRDGGGSFLMRNRSKDLIAVEQWNGTDLPIIRADRRQLGAFLCIASNDVPPSVSKRVLLNINFSPQIKVPNQLVGAPIGTDVKLECHVEAYPNTVNYWVKDPETFLANGPRHVISENRTLYKVSMRMIIKRFNTSDIGLYNCISSNLLGRAEGTLRLYNYQEENAPSNHIAVVGGLESRGHARSKSCTDRLSNCWSLILLCTVHLFPLFSPLASIAAR